MNSVPLEVVYNILLPLSYNDVLNFCQTNIMYSDICEDEYFWRRKLKYDYPNLVDHKPNDISFLDYVNEIYTLPTLEELLNTTNVMDYYMMLYYGFDDVENGSVVLEFVTDVLSRSFLSYETDEGWNPWDLPDDPRYYLSEEFQDLVYDAVLTNSSKIVEFVINEIIDNAMGNYNNILLLDSPFELALEHENYSIINILLRYYSPVNWIDTLTNEDIEKLVKVIPELSIVVLELKSDEWQYENPLLVNKLKEIKPFTFRYKKGVAMKYYQYMLSNLSKYNAQANKEYILDYMNKIEKY